MFLHNTSVRLYCFPMLDIHRLRVFRAVVATGSVNGAASSLGYTPSAISQHLSALQRETGLALVERRGRGIEPTAAGVALADGLGSFFAGLAQVESMVGDLRAGRVGSLRISYFASAGATWIPPVVATLVREFPQLRLDLRLFELAGETPVDADVEIFIEGASTGTGGRVLELLHEPYVAVLPTGHPLAGREQIPLAELRDEQWVDNDFSRGPCRQVVLDACATAGLHPGLPHRDPRLPVGDRLRGRRRRHHRAAPAGHRRAAAGGPGGADRRPGAPPADHAAGPGRAARASRGGPGGGAAPGRECATVSAQPC